MQFSIVHLLSLGGLGRQRGAKFGLSTFLKTCFAHGMHIHAVSDMSGSSFSAAGMPGRFSPLLLQDEWSWH